MSEWRPIVSGSLAERARAYARDIGEELLRPGTYKLYPHSLAMGACGAAVTHGYLAAAFPEGGHADAAAEALERCTEALATEAMSASLQVGFPGIAWSVEHLQGRVLEPCDEDANEAIDDAILTYLQSWSGQTAYDLIFGPVGLGVYALERLPRPAAVTCLELIVDRLAAISEPCPEGIRWHTAPQRLTPELRKKYPSGYYDLGVAHGVPGIVAMLGAICGAGIAVGKARPLLEGAVRWVLAQRLDAAAESVLPSWVGPEVPRWSSRSAWCYGDPSTALGLLLAARAVGEPSWEAEALAMGRHAATRAEDRTGVVDAGLCHGSAGLALIFHRFFQATGEAVFADAARQWIERTLALRKPGDGVAGCMTWNNQVSQWEINRELLAGAAGVALALLAATSEDEPAWDRTLLLSFRAPPARGAA